LWQARTQAAKNGFARRDNGAPWDAALQHKLMAQV